MASDNDIVSWRVGRRLESQDGSVCEVACMRRIASISCLQFEVPPTPARFNQKYHTHREFAIAPLSFHHQAISNAHTHTGSRQTQCTHGRCTCVQFVGVDRSKLWSDFGLIGIKIVAVPPTDAMFEALYHDGVLLRNPIHIHSMDPRHKPNIRCSEQVNNPPRATLGHRHWFRLSTDSRTFCPWGT